MSNGEEIEFESSLEFKFFRDLIRYVLQEQMSGLQWTPEGLFAVHDLDSPFTPIFQRAVKKEFDDNGVMFHKDYDELYPDKSKVEGSHQKNCQTFKDIFVRSEFTPSAFMKYCAFNGLTCGLSYLYGETRAPFQSFVALLDTIKEMKNMGKISDDIWKELEEWLENREQG